MHDVKFMCFANNWNFGIPFSSVKIQKFQKLLRNEGIYVFRSCRPIKIPFSYPVYWGIHVITNWYPSARYTQRPHSLQAWESHWLSLSSENWRNWTLLLKKIGCDTIILSTIKYLHSHTGAARIIWPGPRLLCNQGKNFNEPHN